jgi:TctA family transporter
MDATSRSNRRVVLAILACSLLAFLPTISAAQEPVKSFAQLDTRLKPGDTIYVTDAEGREVKGKIRELTPSALMLDIGDGRSFQAGDVRLITASGGRNTGKGALWGLVAEAAAGALIGVSSVPGPSRARGIRPRGVR